LPPNTDILIHLAANTSNDISDFDQEVNALDNLLTQCAKNNILFIFISSVVADKNARTAYGRTKYKLEKIVIDRKGLIIRLPFVYGKNGRKGLYTQMSSILKNLWFVPKFTSDPFIQTIYLQDFSDYLYKEFIYKQKSTYLGGRVISFNDLLNNIQIVENSCYKQKIIIFEKIIRILTYLQGKFFSQKTILDRFLGLYEVKRYEPFLGNIEFDRDVKDLIRKTFNKRKNLISESYIVLKYLTKVSPSIGALKNYVRYLEQIDEEKFLFFPCYLRRFTSLVAVLDKKSDGEIYQLMRKKINIGSMILESSINDSSNFTFPNHNGKLKIMIVIIICLIKDISFSFLSLFFTPKVTIFNYKND